MNQKILTIDNPGLKRLRKRESIWTQGNGYMGVRASFEEGYSGEYRATLVNGVFDPGCEEVTEIVTLPDTTNFEIEINGERFTMISGKMEDFSAQLNMENGEFTRSLLWTNSLGDKVKLSFRRFVSDARAHIMAEQITVTPLSGDVTINLVTGINGKVTNTGVQHFDNPQKRVYPDGVRELYAQTLVSKVRFAVHYLLSCNLESESKTVIDRRSVYTDMTVSAKKDEAVVFEKIVSFNHSRDLAYAPDYGTADQVKEDGMGYVREAAALGYDKLFEENVASWKKFWEENPVEIQSENTFLNQAVQFAQYHLHIMVSHTDNRLGIGAKALSGEIYKGHSFWDTEIFLLPYYIFTDPKTARRLLEYRYQVLGVAKKEAKRYNFIGAKYCWENAWLDDGESALQQGDLDLVTGKARQFYFSETEIHVTAAIIYGIWEYYAATGDDDFMEKYGNEMIIETALYWTSRAELRNGRYEFIDVIGPDEYKEHVNNNAYTNYMAWHNVKMAQKVLQDCPKALYEKLSQEYDMEDVKHRINDFVEKIYLPKAEEDGIINQFDGCKDLKPIDLSPYKNKERVNLIFEAFGHADVLKMQAYKQGDTVMLFYMLRDLFTEEEIRKNFMYYEERTLHDSSLSMCIHALIAAQLGMDEMAESMFYKACCVDLGENTNNSNDGIHSASVGGIWMMLVHGYGGLQVHEDGISLAPTLPKGWSGYTFPLHFMGTKFSVTVDKDGYQLNRLSGDAITIKVNGVETTI